jgi:acyl-CoA thioester hydrolase
MTGHSSGQPKAAASTAPSEANAFRLRERVRVRWAETDAQGIVFNGHYLTYFDVAITEYWRAVGLPYPATFEGTGIDLFAVKSTVEYLAPARYDDLIDVGCRAARIGRSSLAFELAIWRCGEQITRGEVIYACADPVARKSQPIPERIRQAIATFEAGAPARQ